ncbi:S-adenosyl-L-methionine-dependent methyltransferase [Jimgerdemannia flammicorona]|nr:S-adenosyl-L-methionine-dependent methyltransferase [Jimgerdemannia flammicorona]
MGNGKSRFLIHDNQEEVNRLHYQHEMLRQLVHGNYNAPVEDAFEKGGIKVLDVACGAGSWTLDMASTYASCQFVGTDISDNLLPKSGLPPNCEFLQADTLKGLPFADNTFDYVYQRMLGYSCSETEWNIVIAELIRVTKPGGWIELLEIDMAYERPGPSFEPLLKAVKAACDARGIFLGAHKRFPYYFGSFENVHLDALTIPFGWNGPIGQECAQNHRLAWLAMDHRLAPAMGLSREAYRQLVIKSVQEFAEYKTWLRLPYVYGMKPQKGN